MSDPLARAAIKEKVATLAKDDRITVRWSLADLTHETVTWHGRVLAMKKGEGENDHVATVEYDQKPGYKYQLPAQPWGTLTYFHLDKEGAEEFASYADSVLVPGQGLSICPWKPATFFGLTHSADKRLGMNALMGHLDNFFGLKERSELSKKSAHHLWERATHRETIYNWIVAMQAIDAKQANSPLLRSLLEPTIVRLCALRRGHADGVVETEKQNVIAAVYAAYEKQRSKPSDPVFDLLMKSPLGN